MTKQITREQVIQFFGDAVKAAEFFGLTNKAIYALKTPLTTLWEDRLYGALYRAGRLGEFEYFIEHYDELQREDCD